jgi:hypothetical protein
VPGRRIAAGQRLGQREARDLLAAGEPGEVAVLLLIGAVVEEQLGGAERIGHHHRDRGGHAAGGEPCDDRAVGEGGEAETAEALGDDHPEESLRLHVLPCRGGKIAVAPRLPVVHHAAETVHRAVQERLFRGREPVGVEVDELLPVGVA